MSLRVASRPSRNICKACRSSIRPHKRRRFGTDSITSNPKSEDIYDVITVGGGPVGLAILAALKSSPSTSHLKCALIESQDLSKQQQWGPKPYDDYSNRASSITPTNQAFLESIGAWRHLDLGRVQPYDEMQVWDAGNASSIQFDWSAEAKKYNAPLRTVATMVENVNLSRALLRRVEETNAKDDLIGASSVKRIANGIDEEGGMNMSTWPIVEVQSGNETRQITARLLIGADGINSPVRTFAWIGTNGWDYGRHGVVATLEVESQDESPFGSTPSPSPSEEFDAVLADFVSDKSSLSPSTSERQPDYIMPSNRATAYQRFLPSLGGPIAILPLPNNRASLVWSTTPQVAAHLKSLSPSAFVATVNAALRLEEVDIKYMLSLPSVASDEHGTELKWRLQHSKASMPSRRPPRVLDVQSGTVASFPLRLRNATSYICPRIALAGDAAHTIHPLAGQGLNLGLSDAAALANTISYAVEHGQDIGDLMTLEGYSRARYGKAVEMGSGVDVLNRLYQMGSGGGLVGSLLGKARGLGMWAVGAVPGIREGIMRRAE